MKAKTTYLTCIFSDFHSADIYDDVIVSASNNYYVVGLNGKTYQINDILEDYTFDRDSYIVSYFKANIVPSMWVGKTIFEKMIMTSLIK